VKRRKRTCKHKYEVIRTIWPFEDGWGTHCPKCLTIMDTGLPREEAERRCADLNEREYARTSG